MLYALPVADSNMETTWGCFSFSDELNNPRFTMSSATESGIEHVPE